MSRIRKIIGFGIIGAGILIMLFPLYNSFKKQQEQKKMLNEIYDLMREQRSLTPTATPMARATEAPDGYVPRNPSGTVAYAASASSADGKTAVPSPEPTPVPTPVPSADEEFTSLELAEEEKAPKINVLESERLRGQTLYGIIRIPDIDLTYAVVEGTKYENIGVAIGHFSSSAAFGAEGNCALAGHRGGTSGPYFKDIDKLVKGSEIILTDMNFDEFTYTVTDSFIVDPTDTYVAEDLGRPGRYLTLVTCQDKGTRRLVVRAKIRK